MNHQIRLHTPYLQNVTELTSRLRHCYISLSSEPKPEKYCFLIYFYLDNYQRFYFVFCICIYLFCRRLSYLCTLSISVNLGFVIVFSHCTIQPTGCKRKDLYLLLLAAVIKNAVKITMDDIVDALPKLKRNKAPGPDNILLRHFYMAHQD